ncbi:hypothetical protein [Agromyces sp. GXS1127]
MTRTGMQPNAMWDHDAMYRLRRAVVVGVIGVPVLLIVILLIAATARG